MTYLIGQFQHRVKLYTGILFIGSGPIVYFKFLETGMTRQILLPKEGGGEKSVQFGLNVDHFVNMRNFSHCKVFFLARISSQNEMTADRCMFTAQKIDQLNQLACSVLVCLMFLM